MVFTKSIKPFNFPVDVGDKAIRESVDPLIMKVPYQGTG